VTLTDAETVLFRDTDSRLSIREAQAVDEWLRSGKTIHIIRDHPHHTSAILGGAWGIKPKSFLKDQNVFSTEGYEAKYGLDQEIIRKRVYRNRKISRFIHDSFFVREIDSRKLPQDISGEFIGEIYSAANEPEPDGRREVLNYRFSAKARLLAQFYNFRNIFKEGVFDLLRK
jgi:hypothetical protein